MIKIGIVGGIGVGKSYVAKKFGYPVFNADTEVSKIYKKDKKCYRKLKKALSGYNQDGRNRYAEILRAAHQNQQRLHLNRAPNGSRFLCRGYQPWKPHCSHSNGVPIFPARKLKQLETPQGLARAQLITKSLSLPRLN